MQWPGFREHGALVLPLDAATFLPPQAPLRVRLDGRVLERKRELHITLLGRDQGREMVAALGEARLRTLFESFDWQVHGTGRYALLHKTKDEWDGPLQAWSLVEHLQAPDMAAFRYALAQESRVTLDCGVPHATLYVAGDPHGIGIPSLAAYRELFVREVAAPELRPPAT